MTDVRATRRRQRWRSQPRQIALLTAVWLVLVGEISLVTVVGGVLVSILVTLVFPLPPVNYHGHFHTWGIIRLGLRLLWDLAVSSFGLAVFAFGRRQPSPAIVRIELLADSDLYEVNVAELVSVVPGTIVVDARQRRRILYLHVFDMPDPADRKQVVADTLALERRVLAAFASRAERDAVKQKARAQLGRENP